MKYKSSSTEQSAILNALKVPAIVMVVASHCIILRHPTAIPFELSSYSLFLFFEQVFMSCGELAVSLFSLISGYYFFSKVDTWTLESYGMSMQKRFKSLLIPYVLWNLIAIVACFSKNYIGLKAGLPFAYNEIEYNLVTTHSVWEMLLMPIDNPLWYVREIIYLTIASPLVYVLARNKYVGLVVLLGLYLYPLVAFALGYSIPYNNIQVHFFLGTYLALQRKNVIEFAYSVRTLGFAVATVYIVSLVQGAGYLKPIYLIGNLSVVVSMINLCLIFSKHSPQGMEVLHRLSPSTFFIYATHCILFINLVRGGLYAILSIEGYWEKIITLLLTAPIVLLLTYGAYKIMSKVTPRTLAFLSGGRA